MWGSFVVLGGVKCHSDMFRSCNNLPEEEWKERKKDRKKDIGDHQDMFGTLHPLSCGPSLSYLSKNVGCSPPVEACMAPSGTMRAGP